MLSMAIASRAEVSVTGTRNGTRVELASLLLEFAECRATVKVFSETGLERDGARNLARRLAEPFPPRDFSGNRDSEIQRLRTELGDALAAAKANAAESEALITSQRNTVRDSTIRHHAAVFRREAIGHDRWAQFWLVIAGLAVAGLIGVAVMFFNMDVPPLPKELAAPVLAAHFFAKLALFSIPATALGVAIRQYASARHNWVVATHRSSALASYEAFARATDDKSARDALLAQALALIFSPQDTGYSKAAAAPDSTALFTELVKQVGGRGASLSGK